MKRTNQKGIALLLVLSAIVMLTMIGVEFAYDAQVEYHQALHQKERLQAYYLANSAYNLVRLELKMGSAMQSQISTATQNANVSLNVDLSVPLCQQFPMKTALFRLVVAGGSAEPKSDEEAATQEQAKSSMPLEGAEEFLQFEGDFDAECADENAKIDLNYIYGQDPLKKETQGENAYDQYKRFLMNLLSQNEQVFKDQNLRVGDVVRNMADWIDFNEVINEFGGAEGGSEDAVYHNLQSGEIATKNGKLSIPSDVFMIEGVRDSWWSLLGDRFTIYGMTSPEGKPQINVCRASKEVVKSLILRYIETRVDLPPMKPNDDEAMDQLIVAVKGGCTGAVPDKNRIAQDLDAKLLEVLKAQPTTPQNTPPTGGGGYAPQASSFAEWIATQSRFFSLNLSGQVHDTVVKIKGVIDMGSGGADTSKWKLIYWKVD